MVLFILLVSSFFIGWFFYELSLLTILKFLQWQRTVRLETLVGETSKKLPMESFFSYLQNKTRKYYVKIKLFNRYHNYLTSLLQRMNNQSLKPSDVFWYQILLSLTFIFISYFFLENIELSIIAFVMGFVIPVFWLRDKAFEREKKILRELPNALEILSLCSEAGLSFEQAIDQYLKNCKSGPLKDDFSEITEQTRTGSNRKNALESIGRRLNLTDFSLFTTSLLQAEKFGTGIAKTLQQLSLTMRDKQSQRAEKAVQEMPVKMLFPLILFIMPVTFLIIFGPILLQFFKP